MIICPWLLPGSGRWGEMDSGRDEKTRRGAAWWSHAPTAFCPLFMQCCGLVHRRRVRVSYVSFYCCTAAARSWKCHWCLSGLCGFFWMLSSLCWTKQKIHHLCHELSRHLRSVRFRGLSRDAFVCLSFGPGYFHKIGNNLWGDWSGVSMCVREYPLSQLSVSVQTSW